MGNLEIAEGYLRAIETMGECEDLKQFLAPNIIQTEFPNKITSITATRDLEAMLAGCEQGKVIMASQSYDIVDQFEVDETVILEVKWTGVLKIDLGDLSAGDKMTARFALFLRFTDGKIVEQRNYDCFN